MAKVKFYKNSNGSITLGSNTYEFTGMPPFRSEWELTGGLWYLTVMAVDGSLLAERALVTDYTDSNDKSYTSKSELGDAITGAFVSDDQNNTYQTRALLITRPANVTPVIAGGVLTDIAGSIKAFMSCAKNPGNGINILNVRIQTNDTGAAGKTFILHLYRMTVAAIAYNIAYATNDVNVGKLGGSIPVILGTGNQGKIGQNTIDQVIVNPATIDIPVQLECVEGFTPSSNSTWFYVEIGFIQGN